MLSAFSDDSALLEEFDVEEKSPSTHIEELNQDIITLRKNYYKDDYDQNSSIALVIQFLKFFKYFSDNKTNLGSFSRIAFPDDFQTFENMLNNGDYGFKWVDCIIKYLCFLIKDLTINKYLLGSEEIERAYNKVIHQHGHGDRKIENSFQKNLDRFQSKLEKARKKAKESSELPHLTSKVLSELLIPIKVMVRKTAEKVCKSFYEFYKNGKGFLECNRSNEIHKEWLFHLQPPQNVNIENINPGHLEKEIFYCQKVVQKKLIENIKTFFTSLNKSKSIEEVQTLFKEIKLSVKIPSTIEQFKKILEIPRFKRELFQHYYYHIGQRLALDDTRIHSINKQKQEEFHNKINRCLPIIAQKIDESSDPILSFQQIKSLFAKEHIDICSPTLPQIPENQLEWDKCIQDQQFIKALAAQWVNFQETTAQLSLQALQQTLLLKIEVEREFLTFKKIQHLIGLVSTVAQLSLCYLPFKLTGLGKAIEFLITDLTKLDYPSLGLYYFAYPLYPGTKCKVESFGVQLAKHFFAIKLKPNEYGLESYKLSIQIQMTKQVLMVNSLKVLLQQGMLWINTRLVDNCIEQKKIEPLVKNPHYIALTQEYEQYNLYSRQLLQYFEKSLEELKINDAKLMVRPHLHSKTQDAIKDFVDSIQDADIDYFPAHIIESFENLIGFELTNANKGNLQKHLEDFLAQSGKDFWDSYHNNRFAYLKI